MEKQTTRINYFYVSIILLWLPIQYIIGITTMKIPLVFTVLIFIYNMIISRLYFKQFLTKPVIFWLFWVIFNMINSYIKGVNYMSFTYGALIAEIIISLIIMTIVSLEFTKNANKLVRILLNITLAYSIIGLLNSVNIDGRLMNESMGNALPLNTVFIVFYSGFLYFNKKLNSRILIAVWLLSISLIVLSGTRKAFGASLIIITFHLVAYMRNISFKTIISLVLVIFIFTLAFNYISDNTVIGARIDETIETGERVNTTNIQYLNFLGDRAQQYILAFELFLNNKLTGVGLRNFSSTTLYAYTLHSEYMVQLAECGIIGTSFFLLFNGWILINLVKLIKKNRAGFIILGALLAILFINFTAWTYSSPMYFASYGVVIGYIKTKKNDNCNLCR